MSDPSHKDKRHGAMYESREIYANNVDWNATEQDIEDLFSKYGKVEKVRIPKNLSGKSKGTAFIIFSNKVTHLSFVFGSWTLTVIRTTLNRPSTSITQNSNPVSSPSPSQPPTPPNVKPKPSSTLAHRPLPPRHRMTVRTASLPPLPPTPPPPQCPPPHNPSQQQPRNLPAKKSPPAPSPSSTFPTPSTTPASAP